MSTTIEWTNKHGVRIIQEYDNSDDVLHRVEDLLVRNISFVVKHNP
jgi:hypothetical protein